MVLKYLRDQRHAGTVAEIARVKFPFPNDEFPDLETLVNEPTPRMSVGQHNGKDLFPDIVVVRRPGVWLKMMAEVETADTLTDEEAETEWLPFSRCGDLYLYVPMGTVPEAKKIVKRHKIHLKGIRAYRFRPVWGLEVVEA
ncbi:MAG: hypothetical protein ACM3S1_00640 [Hyphomicrobiales bacterium]